MGGIRGDKDNRENNVEIWNLITLDNMQILPDYWILLSSIRSDVVGVKTNKHW